VYVYIRWVETRERMDETGKTRQKHKKPNDSPFLLQLLPQLEAFDLYLSLPLMVQDSCIRRSVDRRSERVGSGAKVSWTRRAWGRTFAWAKVGEVTDDMAGCTAVFVRRGKI
jgi:hypothetical protein